MPDILDLLLASSLAPALKTEKPEPPPGVVETNSSTPFVRQVRMVTSLAAVVTGYDDRLLQAAG